MGQTVSPVTTESNPDGTQSTISNHASHRSVVFTNATWKRIIRIGEIAGWERFRPEFLNVCVRLSADKLRLVAGDGGYFRVEDLDHPYCTSRGAMDAPERTVLIRAAALPAIDKVLAAYDAHDVTLSISEQELIISGGRSERINLLLPISTLTYPDENRFVLREGDETRAEINLWRSKESLDAMTSLCATLQKYEPHYGIPVELEYDGTRLVMRVGDQEWPLHLTDHAGPPIRASYYYQCLSRFRDCDAYGVILSWAQHTKVVVARCSPAQTFFFGSTTPKVDVRTLIELTRQKEGSCVTE